MKVLIDNGHGQDTAGKRSPDGRLMEYAYAREIARRLETELKARGIDAVRITPERIRRAALGAVPQGEQVRLKRCAACFPSTATRQARTESGTMPTGGRHTFQRTPR